MKHLVAVAVLVLLGGLAYIPYKWPHGIQYTFSQHVARQKSSILYYVALFGITLSLLEVFFLIWFIPSFGLSAWFGVFITLSALTQFGCTLIPETRGWRARWHVALAGISAFCLLPCLWLLVIGELTDILTKLLAIASLVIMTAVAATAIASKRKNQPLLLLQASYFSAFFVPVLFATYSIS